MKIILRNCDTDLPVPLSFFHHYHIAVKIKTSRIEEKHFRGLPLVDSLVIVQHEHH